MHALRFLYCHETTEGAHAIGRAAYLALESVGGLPRLGASFFSCTVIFSN